MLPARLLVRRRRVSAAERVLGARRATAGPAQVAVARARLLEWSLDDLTAGLRVVAEALARLPAQRPYRIELDWRLRGSKPSCGASTQTGDCVTRSRRVNRRLASLLCKSPTLLAGESPGHRRGRLHRVSPR